MSAVGVVAALASEARALGPSMPRGGVPPLSELALLGEGSLLALSGIGSAAATAAALEPEPDDIVSPAPRSHTRILIECSPSGR